MIPSCLQQILHSFTPYFAYCTFPTSLLILSFIISRCGKRKRKLYGLTSRCSGKVKLDSFTVALTDTSLVWKGRLGQCVLPEHPGLSVLNPKQPCRKGKTSECSRHPPCANTHHPLSSRVRLAILWECQKDRRPSGAIDWSNNTEVNTAWLVYST